MEHDVKSPAGYAVVTGGASGLGREFCLRLAHDCWHIAVVDVDAASSEGTRRHIEQAGGIGRVEPCDVTDPAAWQALRDRLQADWPRLDLLVNNAGMFASAPVGKLHTADVERVIRLNLLGVLYGCNTMVPWLVETARTKHNSAAPSPPTSSTSRPASRSSHRPTWRFTASRKRRSWPFRKRSTASCDRKASA